MPDYLNTIKWQGAEKVAIAKGFILRRHNSTSHRQYKKEGVGCLTIPTYKEISIASPLFSSILRQMNITKKEFFETLGR